MELLKEFPITPPNALVNYSYSDIASGTGYIKYLGGVTVASTYILSPNTFYSNNINTTASADTATATKLFDIDFDLTSFQLPITLRGTAYIAVPFIVNVTGASTETNNIYVIAKIRKWDGTTETDIASGQSKTMSVTTSSTGKRSGVVTASVVISPTNFAIGDQLRVTLEVYVWHTQSYSIEWGIGHDPKGRISDDFNTSMFETGDITIMEAHIPYLIG